jgi:hypothetical protein
LNNYHRTDLRTATKIFLQRLSSRLTATPEKSVGIFFHRLKNSSLIGLTAVHVRLTKSLRKFIGLTFEMAE